MLVQASITEYHKLSDLYAHLYFSQFQKLRSLMLTDSVSGETPRPGSQMTIFRGKGVCLSVIRSLISLGLYTHGFI